MKRNEVIEIVISDDEDDVVANKREPAKPTSQPLSCKDKKHVKRAKYERHPTPLCDAIMKAYSEKKKLSKLSGKDESDLNASFIKDILDKSKRTSGNGEKLTNKNASANNKQRNVSSNILIKVSDSKTKADKRNSKLKSALLGDHEKSQNDLLPVTVESDSDVELVIGCEKEIKTQSAEVLKCNDIKSLLPFKNKQDTTSSDVKVEDTKFSEIKCKENNLAELPRKINVLNPSAKVLRRKRSTTNLEKIQSNKGTSCRTEGKPSKGLVAASPLVLAESIKNLLNEFVEDDEDEKLNKLKLHELKQDNLERDSVTDSMDLKMKNEFHNQLENIDSKFGSSNITDSNTSILKNSGSISEKSVLNNTAVPSSSKDKFNFVMDYHESYNNVFNSTHPVFQHHSSDILLLCINALKECLQRMKNAHRLTLIELRHQEVQLAYQAYLNVVMSFGGKFFNALDSIVEKIMGTKTKKAIMITLCYFITNSVYTKIPTYKGQMHIVRDILKIISITYSYHQPLFFEVFEIPNYLYEEILSNLMKIIKVCYERKLLLIPNDNLFALWAEHFGEDQKAQSKGAMDINELVKELNIPSLIFGTSHCSSKASSKLTFPSNQQNIPSYNISDVAAQLFEAIRNKSGFISEQIEKKVDQMLDYLNGDMTHYIQTYESICEGESRKVNTQLPQKLEVCHGGLDNLFTSYLKSTNCNVETDPLEVDSSEFHLIKKETFQLNCNNSISSYVVSEETKQEPEEDKVQLKCNKPVEYYPFSQYIKQEPEEHFV